MSNWWSSKLSGEKPEPKPSYLMPTKQNNLPATQQAPQQRVLDPQVAPTEQIGMGAAIRLWQGGEAARKEGNMICPECGSRNVFSRTGKGHNSMINGASPAPRCFECGWNGKYSQADEGSWNN